MLFYPKILHCLCFEKITLSEPKHEQVKTIPDTPQAKRQLEHASVPTTAMRTQACGRAETLFDGEGLESCVNELINSKQSLGLTMQAPISCKHSLNKEEGWDFLLSFCFPTQHKELEGRTNSPIYAWPCSSECAKDVSMCWVFFWALDNSPSIPWSATDRLCEFRAMRH